MKRNFIITVDTEGDNQWSIYNGQNITTENANFIPRFQEMCEGFGFKPVYLVNYEMANNDFLMDYLKKKQKEGVCEIGTHLHSWNSPPEHELERKFEGNPYITEYPEQIVYEKIDFMTKLIESKVGIRPVVHRAGRWASSDCMFDILSELGYIADCSVVSGCNMLNYPGKTVSYGFDYRTYPNEAYLVKDNLIEIPMTVKHIQHTLAGKSIKNRAKNLIVGKDRWLRPAISTVKEMKLNIDERVENGSDYAEFMIHSTELMPGGSPYFKNSRDVEREYKDMRTIFTYAVQCGFEGITMRDYAKKFLEK